MPDTENNFIVCKAAAGSGKTFKLVNEYLKLCLLSESRFKFGKILAITFTNKASAEMKERIIDHLRALSSAPGEKHFNKNWLDHYIVITGLSEEIIRKRSGEIRESILHNYTSLAVSTIDKFTHKLIRSFARDLRLSADFEIQIESDETLSKSTDELISLAGQDDEVTEILENYLDFLINEGDNWQIEKGLTQFGKQLLNEEAGLHIEKLSEMSHDDFKKVFSFLTEKIKLHEKELIRLGNDFFRFMSEGNLSTDSLVGGSTGLHRHFNTISKRHFDKDTFRFSDTDNKNIQNQTFIKAPALKNMNPSVSEGINTSILNLAEIFSKSQPKYIFYKLLRRSIYNLSLAKQLSLKLNEINQTENIILIEEFNKIISDVVKNDPAPFIYERIGERYHHILIDEFQDTSVLQFNNLLPLIENSLANSHKCLIVGDPKQAIYRWRGGDIDQFIRLPELSQEVSKEIKQTIKNNFSAEELISNYRSGKEIVEFNNEFFQAAASKLNAEYQPIYSNLHQNSTREDGYVELNLLEKDTPDADEKIIDFSIRKINECLEDGFQLSDIAILSRNRREGVAIAEKLHELNIPVISNESLLLVKSNEVNLIMYFIRYLAYPKDGVAGFKIMELHQQILSKENNFDYDKYKNPEFSYKFDTKRYLTDHSIHFERTRLLNHTSYQLILECIRLFFQKETDVYVRFLVEYVYNHWKNKPVDVLELCEWWKEKSEELSIQTIENTDAIKIMTIHSSKGLQFPVVIFPFAEWKSKNGRDWIWVDLKNDEIPLKTTLVKSNSKYLDNSNYSSLKSNEKDKSNLDDLNLMYVALTRPESRLYLISENENTMKNYSPFLQKILKDEGEGIWTKGKKQKYRSIQPVEQPTYPILAKTKKNWEERLRLSVSNTKNTADQEETYQTKKAGILLHLIFEKYSHLEEALDYLKWSAQNDKSIQIQYQSLEKEIRNTYNNIFVLDLLKNKNTLSECSIVDTIGLTYRPDKVCISADSVLICDFKTGKQIEKHKLQIEEYGKLFAEMNYHSIKKYLFYTKESLLVEV